MILDKIPSVKSSVPERFPAKTALVLLNERLHELDTQLNGLPSFVAEQLRVTTQAQVEVVQRELADDIAALEQSVQARLRQKIARAQTRLRQEIARAITNATIAKAYKARAASGTRTTPDSTSPPATTGEQGGAS